MCDVLLHWIIKTNIGDLNISKYLDDVSSMEKVSVGFSKRSNSNLMGETGALGGMVVRIVRPVFRDIVKKPMTFFQERISIL